MNRKQRRGARKSATPLGGQAVISDKARGLLESAEAHSSAGRFAEAEAACRRVLKTQPKQPVALNMLGNILFAMSRFDEAATCQRKAIKSKPDYAKAHNGLGKALRAQGDSAASIECYKRAVKFDPGFAAAHFNLGVARHDEGRLSEAVASYARALKIRPAYDDAENHMGYALQLQGRLDEAAAAYRRVISRVPSHAAAQNNLGNVLRIQGELDESVAVCSRAIELDAGLAIAHCNLGKALQTKGALTEAIASYEQAMSINPGDVQAHYLLGVAFEEMGKTEESLAHYRRALAIDPGYAAIRTNIDVVNRFQGAPEDTIARCRRKLDENPDDPDARIDLGFSLWQAGAAAESAEAIRKAIDIAPRNATAHYTLGLALDSLGIRDEALECFRHALDIEPGDVHALAAEASLLAARAAAKRKREKSVKRVAIHMQHRFHYGILRQVFDAVTAHHEALLTPHIDAVIAFDPDVIVIAESHAALFRARLPRAAVVWVRHGLISKNATCYAARVSDFACLTSAASRDWYIRHGGRPRREFWITGYVQMDPLFRGDSLPTGLAVSPDRKTVLYAPTWNAKLSSAPMLGDRLVELIRGRRDDVSIVIKPHPVIADHHPQWLAIWRALAEADEDVHLVEDRAANVMGYLKLADLLVTDASSVIFEYLAVDRPMVLVTSPDHTTSAAFDPLGIEWRWRDVGEEIHNVEELAGAVDRGLRDPRLGAERRAYYRTQLFGDLTDGRAAERITEHISALEL